MGTGFAEAGPDKLVILTDEYTERAQIDPVVVRKELAEVQQELSKAEGVPIVAADAKGADAATADAVTPPVPPTTPSRLRLAVGASRGISK